MEIKIVKYGGRLNPVYKEIVDIETKLMILEDNEEHECIELNDLLEVLNLR